MNVCDDPRFDELAGVVNSGTCIAIVGAGLSRPQYPKSRDLITTLCIECRGKIDCVLHIKVNVETQRVALALIEAKKESLPPVYGACGLK